MIDKYVTKNLLEIGSLVQSLTLSPQPWWLLLVISQSDSRLKLNILTKKYLKDIPGRNEMNIKLTDYNRNIQIRDLRYKSNRRSSLL